MQEDGGSADYKAEVDAPQEGWWQAPVKTLSRKNSIETRTSKNKSMASHQVVDGALTQLKIHRFGWATDDMCKKCGDRGSEKHRLFLLQGFGADEERTGRCGEEIRAHCCHKWNRAYWHQECRWVSDRSRNWSRRCEQFHRHICTNGSLNGVLGPRAA